jgi:diguanylate cyclase (GGDEF)-like protein
MFDRSVDASERPDVLAEALVVFEPASGGIIYVNAAATALFGISTDVVADRKRASDLFPELADVTTRSFAATYTFDDGPRPFVVSVEMLDAGELASGVAFLARIRPVVETIAAPEHASGSVLALPDERMSALWSVVVRGGLATEGNVAALIREAARGLQLDHATLARLDGDEFVVEYADDCELVGERFRVHGSPAAAALRRSGTFAVLDTAHTPDFKPIASDTRSFLAACFSVGEQPYALTLTAAAPRTAPFSKDDWAYVETVTEALASALEKREADRQVEQLAYFDALTSLPNRIAILKSMDEAIAEAVTTDGHMAVLFLDIDGFKGVNDTVGHRGGDIVLSEVAQRLRGTLRRNEYIGRLGGDEFAIVMPAVSDRREIDSIAQRIGGVLTFPFAVGEYRFSLSASIGVAIYPEDGNGRDELLESADAAMYEAKGDGGSRVRFRRPDEVLGASLAQAAPLVAPRDSHDPRDSGYILCYQPIVDLANNRIVSAEALIRRIHPQHGLLAPERGWSIARDDAGRKALDRWVLREAATQVRAWQQQGLPLRIDVNLAAFDLAEIDDMLADSSLASHVPSLRIEIAQEQFAEPETAEAVKAFVEHCSASGIGFVLDGFDGGLATLSSLSNLPIDAVKLGRPLVEGVITSRTTRAVVVGTIIVAKSLGWNVIAKGVETAAQREALVALGCDAVQGYYVAHPMTAVDFGTWLRGRELVGHGA